MNKFGLSSLLVNQVAAFALGAHRELTATPATHRELTTTASVPVFGSIQSSFGNSFSEENDGHSGYRDGAPIAGIRCSGDYCDNKALKFYTQSPPGGRESRRGPWITDGPSSAHGSVDPWYQQQVSSYDCKDVLPNSYITRLQCQDDRCDNIRFTCESVTGVTIEESRIQTATISDENGDGYTCSPGFVITGIGCSGGWCDNLHLTCSKYNARVTISQIQAVYQYKGIGAVELRAERSLSNALSDARSSSTESSWGVSSTVEVGFAGKVFRGSASVTTETAQSVSSSVSSVIERTDQQISGQTISITSSTECGSPYGVVYQYGYTLIDSTGGASNIRVPIFVCSMQSLPPPKCIPQDCGNAHSVEVNGIGPGCQCCRAGSASALGGSPVC